MSKLIKSVENKSSKRQVLVDDQDLCTDVSLKTTMRKLFMSRGLSTSLKGSGYIKTSLTVINSLTMNGSGAYLAYISMDPSAQSEWSTYAALFDEFRIVTTAVHFIPVYAGSSTAGSLIVAYDNDSLVTPGSQTDVITYQNYKCDALYKGLTYLVRRPNVTSSAYWVDVASPSSSSGSVLYSIGYSSPSTVTCQVITTYHVEFRGRR